MPSSGGHESLGNDNSRAQVFRRRMANEDDLDGKRWEVGERRKQDEVEIVS